MGVTDQLYTARGVQGTAMTQKWFDYYCFQFENLLSQLYLLNASYRSWGNHEFAKRILFVLESDPEFVHRSDVSYLYVPLATYSLLIDEFMDEIAMEQLSVRVEHPDDHTAIDSLANQL